MSTHTQHREHTLIQKQQDVFSVSSVLLFIFGVELLYPLTILPAQKNRFIYLLGASLTLLFLALNYLFVSVTSESHKR